MKNISFEGNIDFDNKEKQLDNYELFSLKITDSLYKKDIGKFLETISENWQSARNNCIVIFFGILLIIAYIFIY